MGLGCALISPHRFKPIKCLFVLILPIALKPHDSLLSIPTLVCPVCTIEGSPRTVTDGSKSPYLARPDSDRVRLWRAASPQLYTVSSHIVSINPTTPKSTALTRAVAGHYQWLADRVTQGRSPESSPASEPVSPQDNLTYAITPLITNPARNCLAPQDWPQPVAERWQTGNQVLPAYQLKPGAKP